VRLMRLPSDQASLANGFIESLRECMPDTAPVRDAVALTRLVLEHPSPTGNMATLQRSLWRLIALDPSEPVAGACQIRELAGSVLSICDYSSSGQVLEMALNALSLRFDDRPSVRMLCVDLGMMAGGLTVVGIEDMVPKWSVGDSRACLMSPGPVYSWAATHVMRVCDSVRRQVGRVESFAEWTPTDLECALLALRMHYAVFKTAMDGASVLSSQLLEDFEENGEFVWEELQKALSHVPEGIGSAENLKSKQWHAHARRAVRRVLSNDADADDEPVGSSSTPSRGLHKAPVPATTLDILEVTGHPTLVVCRSPVIDATDRYDKEEVNRHKVLEGPLPLAAMPSADVVLKMQRALLREFPWAHDVLATIFDDLYGRAKLGIQTFGFAPTLLVGAPGSGKSRLAGRLADEFRIPRMDLSLGGTSDSKVLAGTSRGWGAGKPSDLATFLAIRKSASAVVLLDELDKATYGYGTGIGLQSYLLGVLEPETACRIRDEYLKTECDYSGVLWIATANTLSGIQAPLRTRLRTLLLRQPSAEHFLVIAENVLADISKGWSLERQVLPSLSDIELPWDRLSSARQVRKATEAAVMQWARELQRH